MSLNATTPNAAHSLKKPTDKISLNHVLCIDLQRCNYFDQRRLLEWVEFAAKHSSAQTRLEITKELTGLPKNHSFEISFRMCGLPIRLHMPYKTRQQVLQSIECSKVLHMPLDSNLTL